MVHRRMIPVLAVTAFLLSSAVTASAQFQCFANGGVSPPARAEGLTEQLGDFFLTCTGGTPTALGQPIPPVNVQIFLNTSVTSRLMSSSATLPQLSEALLLLDEPAPGAQFGCPTSTCAAYGNGFGTAILPIFGYYGSGVPGSTVLNCISGVTFPGAGALAIIRTYSRGFRPPRIRSRS